MTTTADKIRALKCPRSLPSPMTWNKAISDAAALVEAEPPQAVRVKPLVDAVTSLNDACDAMWNDHDRIEETGGFTGYPYQIKEKHVRAISEAQQALPAILAAIELTPPAPAPDPVAKTPMLDAMAMRTAAMECCQNEIDWCMKTVEYSTFFRMSAAEDMKEAIAAITLPVDAALAEAMKLPEVKALVEAAYATLDAIDKYNAKNGTHIIGGPPMRLAKALAALKGVSHE